MGFSVVQGTPYIGWFPVDGTDTCYVGQIVTSYSKGGMLPVGAGVFSGNATYNKPWGVVVGTSNATPGYNSTYKCEYITAVDPHTAGQSEKNVMWESNVPRGDGQMWVQVAIITPETVLKGPIFNATYGVAPIVGTVSAGNTSGKNCTTTAAADVAPLTANNSFMYFRSGANRGLYRIQSNTSTTALANPIAFPNDIAVGDTVMCMPFRHFGHTLVQFDAEATFIDSAGNCNDTGWAVNMLRVDLSEAGNEWAMFMFNPVSLAVGIAGIDYA